VPLLPLKRRLVQNLFLTLLIYLIPWSLHLVNTSIRTCSFFILTLIESTKNKIDVDYTALEPNPLDQTIIEKLNYGNDTGHNDKDKFAQLHHAPWDKKVEITNNFTLLKLKSKLEVFGPGSQKFNLVYFDAFAPSKQPEIWRLKNLAKLFSSMEKKRCLCDIFGNG